MCWCAGRLLRRGAWKGEEGVQVAGAAGGRRIAARL
jgi:hypothetical protein